MMYELKEDRFEYKAGTICYFCRGHDYGCVSDDERATGVQHVAMTLDPTGDYPFFTVPRAHIRRVELDAV